MRSSDNSPLINSASLSPRNPVTIVLDDFWGSTLRATNHRCPARQRLEHDHAERFAPADGIQQRRCRSKQFTFAVGIDLAEIDDIVAEMWLDEFLEVGDARAARAFWRRS